jgi:hypothetical protein
MDDYRDIPPFSKAEDGLGVYGRPERRFVIPLWLQIVLLLLMFAVGWLLFAVVRMTGAV